MTEFKDTEGRTWHPRITVLTMRRFEEVAGISLLGDTTEVFKNLGHFSRLLYESVIREVHERKIDYDAFCDALSGEALPDSMTALNAAIEASFPAPKAGEAENPLPASRGVGNTSTDSQPSQE